MSILSLCITPSKNAGHVTYAKPDNSTLRIIYTNQYGEDERV
jgi:hypothetical protein